jgi:hypothetical protein
MPANQEAVNSAIPSENNLLQNEINGFFMCLWTKWWWGGSMIGLSICSCEGSSKGSDGTTVETLKETKSSILNIELMP